MPRNHYYSGEPSDHFDGLRFFNPGQPTTDRGLTDMLRWQFGKGRSRWPGAMPSRPTAKPDTRVAGVVVTMVSHATVLIQAAGCNMLVDPSWSERASPLGWAGPKRVDAPGIEFADLPPIDAVLVSHNHYDHLDTPTLRRLLHTHKPRIIAPLGNDRVIQRAIPSAVVETADWGDTVTISGDVGVTLVPAHHWSARALGDRRMALWCGFIIRSPVGVLYNVGDTGYGDGRIFALVREQFGPPDVAVIPIGAYEPRWFMKDQHVNPDEAVRIMLDCGARQALGVHWGSIQLTDEPRNAPKDALTEALRQRNIAADRFLAFEPGDVWSRPGQDSAA